MGINHEKNTYNIPIYKKLGSGENIIYENKSDYNLCTYSTKEFPNSTKMEEGYVPQDHQNYKCYTSNENFATTSTENNAFEGYIEKTYVTNNEDLSFISNAKVDSNISTYKTVEAQFEVTRCDAFTQKNIDYEDLHYEPNVLYETKELMCSEPSNCLKVDFCSNGYQTLINQSSLTFLEKNEQTQNVSIQKNDNVSTKMNNFEIHNDKNYIEKETISNILYKEKCTNSKLDPNSCFKNYCTNETYKT